MSPGKGQEIGRTTKHEHKRIEQAGSDGEAERGADDPKGSGAGDRRAAGEAAVEALSEKRGGRGLPVHPHLCGDSVL